MSLLQNSWRVGAKALGLAALVLSATNIVSGEITAINYFLPPSRTQVSGITAGPDGALWFTEFHWKIVRVTTDGVFTEYPVPTGGHPESITAGPDGALWFTTFADLGLIYEGKIGRITTAGAITLYPVPSNLVATSITAGADGALWFAVGNKFSTFAGIGRMTVDGVFTIYPLSKDVFSVRSLCTGPDGAVWFTTLILVPPYPPQFARFAKIGRIATTGVITTYTIQCPDGCWFANITRGADGALWFMDRQRDQIGRITTDGVANFYPAHGHVPLMTAGPDGALWFAEPEDNGVIGSVTTNGDITVEWPQPAYRIHLTVGPDHNLWFAEAFRVSALETGIKIGRIVLAEPDLTKPVSYVSALAASQPNANFPVQWSGTDASSGLRDFTIYVSDNGAPFTPWVTQTTARKWTFSGIAGHKYGFYSTARDFALNQEDPKIAAEATTQVAATVPGDLNGDGRVNCTDLAIVKASLGKRTGQLGFDPRADVNRDGVVDVRDLSVVSQKLPPEAKCP
jgi:virginiamycin B lyase